MKLCKVTSDTVCIPVIPELKWWDHSEPLVVVDFQKRYLHLAPRELNGQHIMAAYDQETDTLFIKADDRQP